MNEHLQRGPHPPNMSHVLHYEGSRPPPTPREMYAEGMYASIDEQGHYDHKKQAPPPPKRDPSTRLSSSSQQGNYQEIHVHESHHHQHHHQQQHQQQHHHTHHQQHHHQQHQYSDYHSQQQQHHQQQHHHHDLQHHQQQQYSSQQHQYSSQHSQQQLHHQQHQQHQQQFIQDQQSPRHSGSGSPAMRSKFSHEPQSPSHSGDRPFSYGQIMSPKLNRTLPGDLKHNLPNGIGHTQVSPMSPTRQREESPVMSYGKRESTFPSQAHSPPPHGPPPPVPQGHGSASPQFPSSPVLPRHSITSLQGNARKQEPPRSPIPKLSQRSMSVPCNGNERQLINSSIGKPQPAMSGGYGYNGMGHSPHRTPSPPLPPPPPELLDDSYPDAPPPQQYHQTHHHHQSHHHQQQQHQTQHQQSHMLSQMPHGTANQSLPKTHSQSPSRQTSTTTSRASAAPPPPPLSSIPRTKAEPPVTSPAQSVVPNADHLNRPRKGSYPVDVNGNTTIEQATRTKSQSPTVSPMRGSYDSGAEQSGLLQQINKVQLKKTGGRQSFDEGSPQAEEVKNTPPSPQPVPQSPPVSKETSPMKEAVEVIPVNSAVNMFEKKVESVIKEESRARRRGDTSKNSNMDINIDDIDLNEVPGYTPVTKSTPIWKRDMIEKKNQEKIEEYIAKKRKEKEDAEKWKNVPAWKRKLMMEKEKEKEKKSEAELRQPAQKNVMKEDEEQRKIKIREQQEMERRMDEELQDVPAWKREIMMKRGGAIKNWTDEREEINELELEDQRIADMEAAMALESLPPPPLDLEPETPVANDAQKDEPTPSPAPPPTQTIQQSKASVVLKPQIPKEPEVKKIPRPSIDESKLEEEWDSLPLWKKEIMMKRGGAPTNWGDEREEKNEDGVEQ